jgi:cysteine desulfurase/selenocysteine lyase
MHEPFESYRDLFPHLKSGKLWLNHAAISPLNSRTKQAIDAYLLNRSEGTIDDFPQIVQISDASKTALGTMINAPAKRIGFVNNTSDGLNILANGIQWNTGDRILLNDSEFPTNVVPFLNLKRLGVEIDFVRTQIGEVRLDDIAAAITPRTRLLSISFVQFLSGFRSDLTAIGALCKKNGVIFCVDAIQGLGNTPIDVKESQIDFLSSSGHKWMLSMMGLGFIYLTEEMQSRITQQFVGWTSNKHFFSEFFRYRIDLDDSARRYENGGQNHLGIAAIGESAALLQEAGIPAIHAHLLDLTDIVFTFADERGIDILTPRARKQRSGIVTLNVPDAERVFDALNRRNIIISLRDGKLRISPHFYNTADDIRTVCHAIGELLQ